MWENEGKDARGGGQKLGLQAGQWEMVILKGAKLWSLCISDLPSHRGDDSISFLSFKMVNDDKEVNS
jgi:hypothetical protein